MNAGGRSGNQGGMTDRRLRALLVLLALLLQAGLALGAEPLTLELGPSAASLPEGEIRLAVEKELGRRVTGKDPVAPSDVTIDVVEGNLVIRLRQGQSVVERTVPLPANVVDVPLTVSLIVGNLARDQSVGLGAPPAASGTEPSATAAPAPAATAAPAPAPRPLLAPVSALDEQAAPAPPVPAYRSTWIGLHVAQDMAFVGGNNVCDPNLGQKDNNYACFYEGTTDQPFVHTPFPFRDGIQQGLVVATTRLLASVEQAVTPWVTLGGRAGFAFGGGPPAGQRAEMVNGEVPDRAKGSGGTAFMPWHIELAARGWFLPLTNQRFRAYAQASAGVAQVDAKVQIPEYDCTHAGMPDQNPEQAAQQSMIYTDQTGKDFSPFEQCKFGKGYYNYKYYKPTMVDGWKKMGQAFVSLGAGSMLAVTDTLGVVLNLNAMYMLPASGLVFEPSLGIQYGL
jgi:hypothetical protein